MIGAVDWLYFFSLHFDIIFLNFFIKIKWKKYSYQKFDFLEGGTLIFGSDNRWRERGGQHVTEELNCGHCSYVLCVTQLLHTPTILSVPGKLRFIHPNQPNSFQTVAYWK